MSRSRFKIATKTQQTFSLNITSMTDMFTIMLVFLLQTYTTSDVQIDPVNDLRLPTSNTEKNPVMGIKISVSKTNLLFENKDIAQIIDNQIENSALQKTDKNFIEPLFKALNELNKDTTDKNKIYAGKVLLQADKDIPYSTLKKVFYTASMAGFPKVKLITVAGQ